MGGTRLFGSLISHLQVDFVSPLVNYLKRQLYPSRRHSSTKKHSRLLSNA